MLSHPTRTPTPHLLRAQLRHAPPRPRHHRLRLRQPVLHLTPLHLPPLRPALAAPLLPRAPVQLSDQLLGLGFQVSVRLLQDVHPALQVGVGGLQRSDDDVGGGVAWRGRWGRGGHGWLSGSRYQEGLRCREQCDTGDENPLHWYNCTLI